MQRASIIIPLIFIVLLSIPGMYSGNQNLTSQMENGAILRDSGEYENGILWSSPRTVTWMGNAQNPAMSESNGTFDIVWQDNRNGNWEIYYTKLNSYGFKLVNDTRITDYPGADENPDVASNNGRVYIVWQRMITGYWSIYFCVLQYNDENISIVVHPKQVSDGIHNATSPKIKIDSNGEIHVVWQEMINNKWVIMYDTLDKNGNKIISPEVISDEKSNSTRPVITIGKNDNVAVLWINENSTPGYSVMYRGLKANGEIITPIRRISVVSPGTTVSASYDGGFNVVFSCSREDGIYGLVYTKLNETGITIIDDTNLTSMGKVYSIEPAIYTSRNRMFVTWKQGNNVSFGVYSTTGKEIYTPMSLYSGINVSHPLISIDKSQVSVIWCSKNGNNSEIMVRLGKFPDIFVKNISTRQGTNGKIEIMAEVGNSIETNITISYSVKIDGKAVTYGEIKIYREETIEQNYTLPGGMHRITLILDPNNTIYESNESNNERSVSVYVRIYQYEVFTPREIFIKPGNSTIFNVSLINKGDVDDNYTVTVRNHTREFSVTPEICTVKVPAEAMQNLSFKINTNQSTPVGNYTLNISVSSESGITKNKTITVIVIPNLDFKLYYLPIYYVKPNKMQKINMTLENTGNCNETLHLKIIYNATWPIALSNNTLNLTPGEKANMHILAYVPDLPAFSRINVTLGIWSEKGEIRNYSISLTIAPVHGVEATVLNESSIKRIVNFTILLRNTGNLPELYTLNITGQLSDYAVISEYSLLEGINKSTKVSVCIALPQWLPAGGYVMYLKIIFGNDENYTLPLSVTVHAIHSFTASAVQQGNEIVLSINNTGNAMEAITVIPKTKKNITWVIKYLGKEYKNTTFVILHVNQSAKVVIIPGENINNGNFKVTIKMVSATGTVKNITITMKPASGGSLSSIIIDNLLYIIIGVAAAVAVVVIYILRSRE